MAKASPVASVPPAAGRGGHAPNRRSLRCGLVAPDSRDALPLTCATLVPSRKPGSNGWGRHEREREGHRRGWHVIEYPGHLMGGGGAIAVHEAPHGAPHPRVGALAKRRGSFVLRDVRLDARVRVSLARLLLREVGGPLPALQRSLGHARQTAPPSSHVSVLVHARGPPALRHGPVPPRRCPAFVSDLPSKPRSVMRVRRRHGQRLGRASTVDATCPAAFRRRERRRRLWLLELDGRHWAQGTPPPSLEVCVIVVRVKVRGKIAGAATPPARHLKLSSWSMLCFSESRKRL
mmetsp:Transcript_11081/g.26282  ORF Transcript_11081/g.26282 Transcript_11081/m.26282 type:complete len:291 (-) Transcript_11081:272-1144(-)